MGGRFEMIVRWSSGGVADSPAGVGELPPEADDDLPDRLLEVMSLINAYRPDPRGQVGPPPSLPLRCDVPASRRSRTHSTTQGERPS